MAVKQFNDFDDWSNHKPTDRRVNNTLGSKWKDKDGDNGGHICVIVHEKRAPIAVYQHQFPREIVFEDKSGQSITAFWSKPHTCHEPEEVLRKQYHRDDEGNREMEPTECPMCMLLEWVYQRMLDGDILAKDVLFNFDGATEAKNNARLTAAGMTGVFKAKQLPDILEEQRVPEKQNDFKELVNAKCNYILTVVDYDNPGEGVQNMCETMAVGQGIKDLYQTMKKRWGPKGDFVKLKQPLMIEFNKKAAPKDKYKVALAPSDQVPLTPAHTEALAKPPPPLGEEYEPFDKTLMRAFMEKYWALQSIEPPWDELFGKDTNADSFNHGANAEPAAPPKKEEKPAPQQAAPATRTPKAKAPAKKQVACDEPNCGAMMDEDATKCPKCGAEYDITPVEG